MEDWWVSLNHLPPLDFRSECRDKSFNLRHRECASRMKHCWDMDEILRLGRAVEASEGGGDRAVVLCRWSLSARELG